MSSLVHYKKKLYHKGYIGMVSPQYTVVPIPKFRAIIGLDYVMKNAKVTL